MLFKAVWTAVVILNGMPHGVIEIEEAATNTLAGCESSIGQHRNRAPDWIRGAARLGWDAEIIRVTGKCVPAGQPA
jgi:hypothetical protein